MGLNQGDRRYIYNWNASTGARLKNGITDIYVAANSISGNTGFVSVEFYFANYESCKNAEKESKAGSF